MAKTRWRIHESNWSDRGLMIEPFGGQVVAEVDPGVHQAANAALISMAPEMHYLCLQLASGRDDIMEDAFLLRIHAEGILSIIDKRTERWKDFEPAQDKPRSDQILVDQLRETTKCLKDAHESEVNATNGCTDDCVFCIEIAKSKSLLKMWGVDEL